MKRTLLQLLLLVMICAGFWACNEKDSDNQNTSDGDVDSAVENEQELENIAESEEENLAEEESDLEEESPAEIEIELESDGDLEIEADGDSVENFENEFENENDLQSEQESEIELEQETPAEIDYDEIGNPDYEKNPDLVVLHGPCLIEKRVGVFKVEMNEDRRYTAIDGSARNGVIPVLVPEEAFAEGDCRLLKKRHLFCNPACKSDQTCGFEEVCIQSPLGQDMGVMVFRGLVKFVAIKPIQPGNSYFYSKLSHPGFAENSVIQMATSPGYMGELEMYGIGVHQLTSDDTKWVLKEDEPLVIHWTPAATGARSRIFLEMNIDQHGLTPLNLQCDFADTGEATISSNLINTFISAGVTGYPTGKVTRRTVDSTTANEQCVEFVVSSVRTFAIEVAGHIPCTSDEDCPEPAKCNKTIQQCQ